HRRGDVREVHDPGAVTDRPDAVDAGAEPVVDLDVAALDLHADAFEAERRDVRLEADADEHAVRLEALLLALRRRTDGSAALAGRGLRIRGAREEFDAALLEGALELCARLFVLQRQQVVEQLYNRHVDAVG